MSVPRIVVLALFIGLASGCADESDVHNASPGSTAAAIAAPGGDIVASVTGSAHWYTPDGFFRRLTFAALKHSDGSVDGEWQLVAGATILHGDIICMKIIGNEARIAGYVEHAFFSLFEPNTAFGLLVTDGGEGAGAPADQSSGPRAFRNEPVSAALEFCKTGQAPNPITLEDISLGNIQIWQR